MNLIYLDQINLECNVEVLPLRTVNWDIADGRQAGTPPFYPEQMIETFPLDPDAVVPILSTVSVPQDRRFDTRTSRSPEQAAVITASQTAPAAHIHVFLIGGISEIREIGGATSERLQEEGLENGVAVVQLLSGRAESANLPRICWVNADRVLADVTYTIAHEIGHTIVGEGHPDEGGGVAPLTGTNRSLRLMLSGEHPEQLAPHGLQLVKSEWDSADLELPNILLKENSPQ